jgi:hypothetical protein
MGSDAIAQRVVPHVDLAYEGAFRVPKGRLIGGRAGTALSFSIPNITYRADGDGGSGSLLVVTGFQQDLDDLVEISVPQPSKATSLAELPVARTLNGVENFAGGFVSDDCGLTSRCLGDVEYVEARGLQSRPKAYWVRFIEYIPDTADALGTADLDWVAPRAQGTFGLSGQDPARYAKYMVRAPQGWADQYVGGRSLLVGQNKINNGGSWGPALFAIAPWSVGDPPAPGTKLPNTTLMLYDGFTSTAQTVQNYSHSDQYTDAVWVQAGSRSALVFAGTEGLRSAADVGGRYPDPYEDYKCQQFAESQPESPTNGYAPNCAGYNSFPYVPVLRFFDPAELALVARGQRQPSSVQPYAVFNLMGATRYGDGDTSQAKVIGGIAFDSLNRRLFVVEVDAEKFECCDWYPIVHVFRLSDSGSTAPVDTTPPPSPENVGLSNGILSWSPVVDPQSGTSVSYVIYKNCSGNPCRAHGQWRPVVVTRETSFDDSRYQSQGATLSNYQVRAMNPYLVARDSQPAQEPALPSPPSSLRAN